MLIEFTKSDQIAYCKNTETITLAKQGANVFTGTFEHKYRGKGLIQGFFLILYYMEPYSISNQV